MNQQHKSREAFAPPPAPARARLFSLAELLELEELAFDRGAAPAVAVSIPYVVIDVLPPMPGSTLPRAKLRLHSEVIARLQELPPKEQVAVSLMMLGLSSTTG